MKPTISDEEFFKIYHFQLSTFGIGNSYNIIEDYEPLNTLQKNIVKFVKNPNYNNTEIIENFINSNPEVLERVGAELERKKDNNECLFCNEPEIPLFTLSGASCCQAHFNKIYRL